jgi:hypothetical protein
MQDQEEALCRELRRVLSALARNGHSITYRDLASLAGIDPPHAIHRLTLALERLAREDHAAGRPLLSALAVSRVGAVPGRGFFELLSELGRFQGPSQGPQAALHHAEELALALAYWGAEPPADSASKDSSSGRSRR